MLNLFHKPETRSLSFALLLSIIGLLYASASQAIPVFARKYNLSCNTCHAAFPRLNEFGEQFIANNYRLPNWKDGNVKTGDDMLALPDSIPMAVRAQAYVQQRKAGTIDVLSGAETRADTDIQAPYLIKILSSAPLSDHISYYFYAIFAEKGGNGEVIVEDAWFSHDNLFDSGVGMMLGQFQISDLMFPRETRLTFQDFMVYRMAGLTYDRGLVFSRELGPLDIALGWANGNGIESNSTINGSGFKRPDHLFDNNSDKAVFGRLGFELASINTGLFAYSGSQKNRIGDAGLDTGTRNTDKKAYGMDFSGKLGNNSYWFAQYIMNNWDGFINVAENYQWQGGFIGVDYIHNDHWTFSGLYNNARAGDLKNTDTIYEGIDINALTLTASYYFMRNVKAIFEVTADMQDTVNQSGTFYTGHLNSDSGFLIGLDAAF